MRSLLNSNRSHHRLFMDNETLALRRSSFPWLFLLAIGMAGCADESQPVPSHDAKNEAVEDNRKQEQSHSLVTAAREANKVARLPRNTLEEKRAFVQQGGDALRMARNALRNGPKTNTDGESKSHDWGPEMRTLERLFYASSEIAEAEGRYADAAQSGIDLVRLAAALSTGASLNDYRLAFVCKRLGALRISAVVPHLETDTCVRLIAELSALQDSMEPVDAAHARKVARAKEETPRLYKAHLRIGAYSSQLESWHRREKISQAEIQLSKTKLAIRAYHSEKGELPARLAQLVPSYLDHVPKDPFGSGPLKYHANDNQGYTLYSVGPDSDDDGGVHAPRDQLTGGGDGDLFLRGTKG